MSSILDIKNLVLDNTEAIGVLDIEDLNVEDEYKDKVLDLEDDDVIDVEDDVGPPHRGHRPRP